jgi:hypothetical protein
MMTSPLPADYVLISAAVAGPVGDRYLLEGLALCLTTGISLLITDVAFFPPAACHPANAIGLKVFPPNTRTATVVSFSFRACARKGPVFLRVRTTVAGTGIPGFSS